MTRPLTELLQFSELAKGNHSVKFFDDSWDTTIEFAERYIAFKPPQMDCDGRWIYCLYHPLSVASGQDEDSKDPVVFPENGARRQNRHSRVKGATGLYPQKANAIYKANKSAFADGYGRAKLQYIARYMTWQRAKRLP